MTDDLYTVSLPTFFPSSMLGNAVGCHFERMRQTWEWFLVSVVLYPGSVRYVNTLSVLFSLQVIKEICFFKYQLISWIAVFFQQENLFVISELKDILPFYRNKCQELIAGHSTNRIWIDTNNIISKFYRTFWTLIASLIFVCCQYRWLDEWVGLCSLDGGTLHVSSFCVCMLGDLWCTRPTPSNGSRHCDVKQSLRGSTRLIGKKSDFCWELVSLTGTGRITWLLSLVLCCTSPEQGW